MTTWVSFPNTKICRRALSNFGLTVLAPQLDDYHTAKLLLLILQGLLQLPQHPTLLVPSLLELHEPDYLQSMVCVVMVYLVSVEGRPCFFLRYLQVSWRRGRANLLTRSVSLMYRGITKSN